MVVRLDDSCTGDKIVAFYNPHTKRYYVFLFGYVDNKFRIKRYVRELWVATWCTFASRTHKDWTKNLYINANGVASATDADWSRFTSDSEFLRLINDLEDEAFRCCIECYSLFGLVPDEPEGTEISTCYVEPLCESARITVDGELLKRKTWDVCR